MCKVKNSSLRKISSSCMMSLILLKLNMWSTTRCVGCSNDYETQLWQSRAFALWTWTNVGLMHALSRRFEIKSEPAQQCQETWASDSSNNLRTGSLWCWRNPALHLHRCLLANHVKSSSKCNSSCKSWDTCWADEKVYTWKCLIYLAYCQIVCQKMIDVAKCTWLDDLNSNLTRTFWYEFT